MDYAEALDHFEDRAANFVQVFNLVHSLFCVHDHGAKLVETERALVQTKPFLDEENRSRRRGLDEDSCNQPDRRRDNDQKHRGYKVKYTLRKNRSATLPPNRLGW
jgi:hypothetical protein